MVSMGWLVSGILAQAEEGFDLEEPTWVGGGVLFVFLIFFLAVTLLIVAASWRLYAKAGKPGWGVLIPIYNFYLLCKISGRPGWWTVLFFIPIVNIVIALVVSLDLARVFGQGAGVGLGLFFLPIIFVPVLAFGGAAYQAPAAA